MTVSLCLAKMGKRIQFSSCKLRTSLMAVLNSSLVMSSDVESVLCPIRSVSRFNSSTSFDLLLLLCRAFHIVYETTTTTLFAIPIAKIKLGGPQKNIPTIIEYTKKRSTFYIISPIMHAFWLVLTYDLLKDKITPIRIYHSSAVMGGALYKGTSFTIRSHFRSAETQSTSE